MARYKAIDTSPRFLAVDLEKQLLPVPKAFSVACHESKPAKPVIRNPKAFREDSARFKRQKALITNQDQAHDGVISENGKKRTLSRLHRS